VYESSLLYVIPTHRQIRNLGSTSCLNWKYWAPDIVSQYLAQREGLNIYLRLDRATIRGCTLGRPQPGDVVVVEVVAVVTVVVVGVVVV